MQQEQTTFRIQSHGLGLYEFTHKVNEWVAATGIEDGLLTLLIQHTSASLTIQENADPEVQGDLTDALERLAPMNPKLYRHTAEGPDDMPAHIKAALTDTSLSIPVLDGRPRLGTWQGIYMIEHRTAPHLRRIAAHLLGG